VRSDHLGQCHAVLGDLAELLVELAHGVGDAAADEGPVARLEVLNGELQHDGGGALVLERDGALRSLDGVLGVLVHLVAELEVGHQRGLRAGRQAHVLPRLRRLLGERVHLHVEHGSAVHLRVLGRVAPRRRRAHLREPSVRAEAGDQRVHGARHSPPERRRGEEQRHGGAKEKNEPPSMDCWPHGFISLLLYMDRTSARGREGKRGGENGALGWGASYTVALLCSDNAARPLVALGTVRSVHCKSVYLWPKPPINGIVSST
jgi:hypothetical protein